MRKENENIPIEVIEMASFTFFLLAYFSSISGMFRHTIVPRFVFDGDRSKVSRLEGSCLRTYLDNDGDGTPDNVDVRFCSSFHCGVSGYSRKPSVSEIDWYRNQHKIARARQRQQ